MVDGVIVSQERARVVLETESRQRIDPGLAEHVRGNLFRTRIYPLPPQGSRTVTVTWTAPLAVRGDEAALRLPLPRVPLPALELDLDISAGGVEPVLGGFGDLRLTAWAHGHRASARLTSVVPGDDLLVRLPRLPAQLVQVEERAGERFALISVAAPAVKPQPAPRRLAVAWDASGSQSDAAVVRTSAALAALLRARPGLVLDVVPFHIVREPARSFTDADELTRWLAALPRDGATALTALDLSRRGLPHADAAAWLLTGDGLATWGEGLPTGGDVPVFCLVAEAVRDDAVLRLLAARSGGAVIDLAVVDAKDAAAQVLAGGRAVPRLDAPAGVLDDAEVAERGGRALVLARLRGAGRVTLAWPDGGSVAVDLDPNAAVAGRVVSRGWAGARAAALAVLPDANRAELLALGRTYGVVTAGTSLLVLERLDQYLRHNVEPPATWPEMHTPWLAARKQRGDQRQARDGGHLERLATEWAARQRWWQGAEPRPGPVAKVTEQRALASASPAPATAPVGREEAVADLELSSTGVHMSIGAGSRRSRTLVSAKASAPAAPLAAAIAIAGWNPDTPWLRPLRQAPANAVYAAWLALRSTVATNPSAVLDCASFVLPRDRAQGLRILSNLAELRLDDPALLRVLAWRLQDADDMDAAVALLRRVLRLRPEEPQSYRDLALALGQRFRASGRADDATEAMELLRRVALRQSLEHIDLGERWTVDANWSRFPGIEVIALEELNRLAAHAPGVPRPELDPRLSGNLDCDLRVVMAWDADATDIDLHVRQPDGDVASYARNRTSAGGLVSPDCTQGYGPEEYLIRKAIPGSYHVFVRYFGSRQTGLLGPATVTATVFTDWGRPSERSQRLTLRLDRQGDAIPIGDVTVGQGAGPAADGVTRTVDRTAVARLALGMGQAAVEAELGRPERREGSGITILVYRLAGGGTLRLGLAPGLVYAREVVDGAERDLLR